MASIPLNQINRGAITLAPPWSHRLFKLGLLATPKGVTPPQLRPYLATGMNANLAEAIRIVRASATGKSKRKKSR